MKMVTTAFKARARTIDHLGKGQIADCPTAVSELWKNAYDAYARDVILHTYDGDYKSGIIADNGCGMSIKQLIDSWLVVGTESKSTKRALPNADRFGLELRKTQGEKGIGRLSSAFLAPVTFLITKKIKSPFSAVLIDWRLFENTYLSLSDIVVPLTEFDEISQIDSVFKSLILTLESNFCSSVRNDISVERQDEIRSAWKKFGEDQREKISPTGDLQSTTESEIISFCKNFSFNSNIANSWIPILEKYELIDGGTHGTAIFLLDLERDLALLTNPGSLAKENEELADVGKELVDTLRAFINPFENRSHDFKYEIKTFSCENFEKTILRQSDVFDKVDFDNLEHCVEGEFDEKGWFTGTVKAWGSDKGIVRFAPPIEMDNTGSKVGPFKIKIGAFENDIEKSSLSESEYAGYIDKQKKYAGLMIFRDDLRVLPYGRVDNDFFEIEERRSYSAGRFYWSKRRIFGQVLITQNENSLLRDKAGREGFIRNQAARELRSLVSATLIHLADRFFGGKSEERKELLELVKRDRDARKEAQTFAKKQSQKSFLEELKNQTPELISQLNKLRNVCLSIENGFQLSLDSISNLDNNAQQFETMRGKLKPPIKPPRLGDHEEKYRQYRDMYGEFSAHLINLKNSINKYESEINIKSPLQFSKKHFERNQALLNVQVTRFINGIEGRLNSLTKNWTDGAKEDRSKYYRNAFKIIEDVEEISDLESSLNGLDLIYTQLFDEFQFKYDGIARVLMRLEQGVDLDSAFSMAEEEKNYFEEKAKNLQALAQLGISVEILAHELSDADDMVTSGLNSLPNEIKRNHPGFKLAYNAHKSLTQQIRFLSPLKISGYQIRKKIFGTDIQDHILKFFGDRFEKQRVTLKLSSKFLAMSITDLPSRIYPVFVNLINNALYWVCLSAKERNIEIDILDGEVIIANSGPPVDIDDIHQLFELFYTRRSNGNGVGLYLCKENLAMSRHRIKYNGLIGPKLIKDGANFAIIFNGLEMNL